MPGPSGHSETQCPNGTGRRAPSSRNTPEQKLRGRWCPRSLGFREATSPGSRRDRLAPLPPPPRGSWPASGNVAPSPWRRAQAQDAAAAAVAAMAATDLATRCLLATQVSPCPLAPPPGGTIGLGGPRAKPTLPGELEVQSPWRSQKSAAGMGLGWCRGEIPGVREGAGVGAGLAEVADPALTGPCVFSPRSTSGEGQSPAMTHPQQAAGPLGPESSSPAEAAAGPQSQES